MSRAFAAAGAILTCLFAAAEARADDPIESPTGPPPDSTELVTTAPKAPDANPVFDPGKGAHITFSAGGQLATGNSRLLAGTVHGTAEKHFGSAAIGGSILGNFGQGAPAGQEVRVTTENLQGRFRTDQYFGEDDRIGAFTMITGRHDRFQGLDFRLNVDPGVKYLFLKTPYSALWGEAGYDLQHDVRSGDSLAVLDANGAPLLYPDGSQVVLPRTDTDHSMRLFFGYRHGFNKEVTLSTGVEYLQSILFSTRYRLNADALFAAKVSGGFAVGLAFSARYDHSPLPQKVMLDTSSSVSLVYSFSSGAPSAAVCTPPASAPPSTEAPAK